LRSGSAAEKGKADHMPRRWLMPGGSRYSGPPEALELYTEAVTASRGDSVVKGAKTPYTSHAGHMFSFLDSDGRMALRLSDELREAFLATYDSGPVVRHGSVMQGYCSVPDDLLRNTGELAAWLTKSHRWISTLVPKQTKK
jgi:hypothetical protein